MADIAFVLMPYAAVERPSAALGLLKAACREVGLEASVLHANLLFAEEIGLVRYQFLVHQPAKRLMGEWTFAPAAFPSEASASDEEAYLAAVTGGASEGSRADRERRALLELRRSTAAFVDRVARRVLAERPRVVASSATFQQHTSSLALLRRVRELCPDVVTVLGGASCDGPMGAANRAAFPWLDYVCSGEGDAVVRELFPLLLREGRAVPARKLPVGVVGGEPPRLGADPGRATLADIESQPVPDYSDYFDALGRSPLQPYVTPALPVETSRGCWWGQLHHCAFCGIGPGMQFRSKSPERVLRELDELSRAHGTRRFLVLDDILAPRFYRTLLPRLAEVSPPYCLNYEIKPNLRRADVEALAKAGVRWAQPGLESLSDEALRLMNKGTSRLTNLQTLKWAREHGVRIGWNFLFGIPFESPAWYSEIASWLPQIHHLDAPQCAQRVAYYRFSPYFERAADHGLRLSPVPEYGHVFPLDPAMIEQIAYYFAAGGPDPTSGPEHAALAEQVDAWQRLSESEDRPSLTFEERGQDELVIRDTRSCRTADTHVLQGTARLVHRACDAALTPDGVVRQVAASDGIRISAEDVTGAVRDLVVRRLALEHRDRCLTLAVRGPVPEPPDRSDSPAGFVDLAGYLRDQAYRRLLQVA